MNSRSPQAEAALALLRSLSSGDVSAVRDLYSGPAEIDDPFHGRHVDGGFESMVHEWAPAHLATVAGMDLTHVVVESDKSAAEITLHLEKEGEPTDLFVVVMSDHSADGRLKASRLYYRRAVVDGRQHHRRPILDARPYAMNEVLERYQIALGTGDVKGMLSTFGPGFHLDGHGQDQDMSKGLGMGRYDREEVEDALYQMFGLNPAGGATLEKLNSVDDGTTTVLEFNLYQGVPEDPEPRSHAGVAAYELGPDGLLLEARIYDEAW